MSGHRQNRFNLTVSAKQPSEASFARSKSKEAEVADSAISANSKGSFISTAKDVLDTLVRLSLLNLDPHRSVPSFTFLSSTASSSTLKLADMASSSTSASKSTRAAGLQSTHVATRGGTAAGKSNLSSLYSKVNPFDPPLKPKKPDSPVQSTCRRISSPFHSKCCSQGTDGDTVSPNHVCTDSTPPKTSTTSATSLAGRRAVQSGTVTKEKRRSSSCPPEKRSLVVVPTPTRKPPADEAKSSTPKQTISSAVKTTPKYNQISNPKPRFVGLKKQQPASAPKLFSPLTYPKTISRSPLSLSVSATKHASAAFIAQNRFLKDNAFSGLTSFNGTPLTSKRKQKLTLPETTTNIITPASSCDKLDGASDHTPASSINSGNTITLKHRMGSKSNSSPNLNVKVNVNVGFNCRDKECKIRQAQRSGCTPQVSSTATTHMNGNNDRGDPKHEDGVLSDEAINDSIAWEEKATTMTVAIRMRPLNEREKQDKTVLKVVSMNKDKNTVAISGRNEQFAFDKVLDSFDFLNGDSQETCYRAVGNPLLNHAFDGYNVCLFAYGQTGSGKTYSLTGDEIPEENVGFIPRFVNDLFANMDDSFDPIISLTYLEIYNDNIFNLLDCNATQEKVVYRVREHPTTGPYVANLIPVVIQRKEDLLSWLSIGNIKRQKAATTCNEKSSRSHAITTLTVSRKSGGESANDSTDETDSQASEGERIVVKINFVDLAGSERASVAQTTGDRLKEGASINRSLLTLGKVISELSDKADKPNSKIHISYRESTLTWLLKESIGGNSKTCMLATISPTNHNVEETVSTLRYASKAQRIVNRVRVNEDPKTRIIRDLRAQIALLKEQMQQVKQPVLDMVPVVTEPVVKHVNGVKTDSKLCQIIETMFSKCPSAEESSATSCASSEDPSLHVKFRETLDINYISRVSSTDDETIKSGCDKAEKTPARGDEDKTCVQEESQAAWGDVNKTCTQDESPAAWGDENKAAVQEESQAAWGDENQASAQEEPQAAWGDENQASPQEESQAGWGDEDKTNTQDESQAGWGDENQTSAQDESQVAWGDENPTSSKKESQAVWDDEAW